MTHLQRPIASTQASAMADRLDAVLPQTQCRQCGFAGCRPYAEAMAAGEADINRCPPGGEAGIRRLARIAGRDTIPLAPELAAHKPLAVAVIDENDCIGCTLCIQACPVDAILGAAKLMHTIISDECTGCELCVAPCPVDCIRMENVAEPPFDLAADDELNAAACERGDHARQRHRFHLFRLERERNEKARRLAERAARARAHPAGSDEENRRQALTEPRKQSASPTGTDAPEAKQAQQRNALIQAAMDRARKQREALSADLTPEQRHEAVIKAAMALARQKQGGRG